MSSVVYLNGSGPVTTFAIFIGTIRTGVILTVCWIFCSDRKDMSSIDYRTWIYALLGAFDNRPVYLVTGPLPCEVDRSEVCIGYGFPLSSA